MYGMVEQQLDDTIISASECIKYKGSAAKQRDFMLPV